VYNCRIAQLSAYVNGDFPTKYLRGRDKKPHMITDELSHEEKAMNQEDSVIEGSGNVFADLGYPNAEEHQTKAKLVSQIAKLIDRQGLTQTEAAIRLGIDQPKISAMLGGRFRGFSVYRLMCFIAALGGEVEIVTHDPHNHAKRSERIAVQYTPPVLSPLPATPL